MGFEGRVSNAVLGLAELNLSCTPGPTWYSRVLKKRVRLNVQETFSGHERTSDVEDVRLHGYAGNN